MIAVNTNIDAMMSFNYSRLNQLEFGEKVQRLSSGSRLNTGAIDPSGLAISSGMTAHLRGVDTAISNALDNINLLRTADSALNTVQDILINIRDLSVRLANEAAVAADPSGDPLSPKPATIHQAMELHKEIEIMKDHLYNSLRTEETGNPLRIIPSLVNYNGKSLFDTTGTSGYGFADDGQTAQIGPDNSTSDQIQIIFGDIAELLENFETPYDPPLPADSTPLSWYRDYAQMRIDDMDEKISLVSDVRTQIGTWENRIQHTIDDLQADYISVSAAKSRISDANMAEEITALTKNQIRVQTEKAMASQAVAVPLITLPLLEAIYDGMMPQLVGFGAE